MKKGSMIWFKKVLGIGVLMMGLGFLLINSFKEVMLQNPMPTGIVLLTAGYFLLKSGRQK